MENTTKTVALHNLGCKVNEYETEIMQQNIQKAGWQIVQFSQKADIYIVNTCSVTNIADRKSRQMLHKARKQNKDAIVVAVGCFAQTDTEGALSDEAIDIVVGNNHKAAIVQIIEEYIKANDKRCVVDDLSKPTSYEETMLEGQQGRTRVDVKVTDGCNQFCSYCIIPYARGRVRSRSIESTVLEVERLASSGVKEIILTGIHLSSYGLDFYEEGGRTISYNEKATDGDYTNIDLIKLIKSVSDVQGIERIRLGSLEPRVITEAFLGEISNNPKICPHFHLSLQSGCDDTLKRMNRRYSAMEYESRVKLIRRYFMHPAITTDIIVGFPGETDEEFHKTCEFVDKINFYETHIFKYSRRKGTVAHNLPNQLTEAQKAIRGDVLLVKNSHNAHEFRNQLIGNEVEVLLEQRLMLDGIEYSYGYTKDYVKVALKGAHLLNQIVSVTPTGFLTEDILFS